MKANSNLKRSAIKIGGGLLCVGLLTALIFTAENRLNFVHTAQAQETTAETDSTQFGRRLRCSNETLAGKYAVIGGGFAAPPPAAPVPFATISQMTLDGAGNLSNKVTRSNNGQISRGVDSGNYSVNADCTGTITILLPAPPFQLTFDLVVADLDGERQGKEFYFIATTPGGVTTAAAKRIQ